MPNLKTAIPSLDTVLGGGIPREYLLAIVGPPGTGKTVLAQQIALNTARSGGKVFFSTTLSEPHAKLLTYMRGFTFFDESLMGEQVVLVNLYSLLKQGVNDAILTLTKMTKDENATLLVIDSLRGMRDIGFSDEEVSTFLYELSGTLAMLNCTIIALVDYAVEDVADFPELAIADGIIALHNERQGVHHHRYLEILKMRGMSYLKGLHSMKIGPDGVSVFPWPELSFEGDRGTLKKERAGFGIPALDDMMQGGPLGGSTTTVLGPPGSGKTLLSLCFAAEGARRGEPSLLVSFRESSEDLRERARGLGLPVDEALTSGRLAIMTLRPVDVDPDELAWTLKQKIEEMGARRLVLDDTSPIEWPLLAMDRLEGYFAALTGYLESKGITSCFTREVMANLGAGTELDELSHLAPADNLVLLRRGEANGKFHYTVSVLKMRGSQHDRSIKQYTFSDGTFKLVPPRQVTPFEAD